MPGMPMNCTKDLLRNHYLFSALTEAQLDSLLSASKSRNYQSGQGIISQGQPASDFFLVLDGQVKLHLASIEGKEKIIKFVKRGDTFAEALMFLRKSAYPVNATATTRSSILCIPSPWYYRLLSDNSNLCLNMLGSLCLKLREHVAEIEMLTVLDAPQRVARFFCELMPESRINPDSFALSISKKNIAEKLAMRPETLSRILTKMEQEAILCFSKNRVKVFDRSKLEDMQRCHF